MYKIFSRFDFFPLLFLLTFLIKVISSANISSASATIVVGLVLLYGFSAYLQSKHHPESLKEIESLKADLKVIRANDIQAIRIDFAKDITDIKTEMSKMSVMVNQQTKTFKRVSF